MRWRRRAGAPQPASPCRASADSDAHSRPTARAHRGAAAGHAVDCRSCRRAGARVYAHAGGEATALAGAVAGGLDAGRRRWVLDAGRATCAWNGDVRTPTCPRNAASSSRSPGRNSLISEGGRSSKKAAFTDRTGASPACRAFCQIPVRSGFPSGVRGVGAVRSGCPSACEGRSRADSAATVRGAMVQWPRRSRGRSPSRNGS
jgi:hypothetical protein